MNMVIPFYKQSIAEIADRLIETFEYIIKEAPSARTIEELADVFLDGDRKIYTGIMLGLLTLILIIFWG
jgi:hypothetical protein